MCMLFAFVYSACQPGFGSVDVKELFTGRFFSINVHIVSFKFNFPMLSFRHKIHYSAKLITEVVFFLSLFYLNK